MTTVAPVLGTSTAITLTAAGLATSSTRLAGRAGTAVDLTALGTFPVDVMLGGQIMTGTSPTAGIIELWASASEAGSVFAGNLPATDQNSTLTAEMKALMRLVASIATNSTSNLAYPISPVSLYQVFAGIIPRKFNLWLVHSTAVNLNATGGNHFLSYTPINYVSS